MKTLFLSALLVFSFTSLAQEKKKVVLTEFIREIQLWHKEGSNMALTFWIPNSYWRMALEESPNATEESIELIENAFGDFIFLCVLDLEFAPNGNMSFKDEETTRKNLYLRDDSGKILIPLKDKDIPETTLYFLETMKPMFEKMLGQMGEGMHFYIFNNVDKKGNNYINEEEKNSFIVKHANHEFEFKLPLVVLMPDKFCPTDNELMKGNWEYCPFHGVKLD